MPCTPRRGVGRRVEREVPNVSLTVADLALQWDVVSRVGIGAVLDILDAREIPRALVHSYYSPVRLRSEIARDFWSSTLPHFPLQLFSVRTGLPPPDPTLPTMKVPAPVI